MSLLTDAFEKCTIIDKRTVSDGYGGYNTEWVDGAEIEAAIVFDNSLQARTAEKAGVTSLYTVTTKRNVVLNYHDVFRRQKDNKIFRVTSDGDDKVSPVTSSLDMRQCTAEEFILGG
jgi:hypothetical protein